MTLLDGATWLVAGVAMAGVIVRPWRLPEATWAVLGGLCLVASSLLPWRAALTAVGRGTDVYLFLAGMMLLAELARQEGLFDWLAAEAGGHARGSPRRLFGLVFAVGTAVTVFLSNDATAVVLTPAVYSIARRLDAEPLPYLFICAFIANAASFVLPISNPANLVVFGEHMPGLGEWLSRFTLPSLLAIAATWAMLRWTQRAALRGSIAQPQQTQPLGSGGRLAAAGIVLTAAVLLGASALQIPLGWPTFIAGVLAVAAVHLRLRRWPRVLIGHVSWSVLPLVAGLFVLVEGLAHTGVVAELGQALKAVADHSPTLAAGGAGLLVALACNLMNNLPAGLIAGLVLAGTALPMQVSAALLIGVDLGPNLSVTGSLATILWLVALRREGVHVSAWRFLRLGVLVMFPALLLSLGAVLAGPG